MSKKIKPIEPRSCGVSQSGCRIELVGYPQTKGYALPYIRLETLDKTYLGSLDRRQVRRLKDWCEKALGEKK